MADRAANMARQAERAGKPRVDKRRGRYKRMPPTLKRARRVIMNCVKYLCADLKGLGVPFVGDDPEQWDWGRIDRYILAAFRRVPLEEWYAEAEQYVGKVDIPALLPWYRDRIKEVLDKGRKWGEQRQNKELIAAMERAVAEREIQFNREPPPPGEGPELPDYEAEVAEEFEQDLAREERVRQLIADAQDAAQGVIIAGGALDPAGGEQEQGEEDAFQVFLRLMS